MKKRLYFLDNLRTFLIFLVVLLHSGIVYESILENTWIVVDPEKNNAIGLIRLYLDVFVMFTLFFISGYFIPISLKSRTALGFLKSKFNRILLPWIVAVITMIPAYKAIFLYSRGLQQEEWYTYFHIFRRPGGDMSFFADNPVQNWLWFLPVLFVFQVLFMVITKSNIDLKKISIKNGVMLTIIIGLIYMMAVSSLNLTGWHHSAIFHFQRERLLVYFLVFLLGSLCYYHNVFDAFGKDKKMYIWSNVILTLSLSIFTVMALNLFFNMMDPGRNHFFVSSPVDRSVYYFTLLSSMFSFLYIWIYTFKFYINKTNKFLDNLSKNSYYVYIIHVVVIGMIAHPLLSISLPAIVKYFLLGILSFIISNVLVTLYRKSIQKSLSNDIVSIGVLILAGILTIAVYTKQSGLSYASGVATSQSAPTSMEDMNLHEAALQGNIEVIQQHISNGSDLNIKDPATGNSPLHTAAAFGKTEAALNLIDAGADVNFINNEGSTPLLTAAFFCHIDIVKALLANGADKSIKNNDGSTALSTISGQWVDVKGVYEYFDKTLGPVGMKIDYEHLKKTRPIIAELLK